MGTEGRSYNPVHGYQLSLGSSTLYIRHYRWPIYKNDNCRL